MIQLPNLPKLTNRQMALSGAAALVLCVALAAYAFRDVLFPHAAAPSQTVQAPPPTIYRDPFTGAKTDALVPAPDLFGVMVENMVDARPQSGLDQASLVFEAPVEGGITRFVSFFETTQPDVAKIGPVRSARPYYVDWVDEMHAIYAHVGGSNAALDLISTNGTFDLNEFYNGQYFWRSTDRLAPHNAYTSTAQLKLALAHDQGIGKAPSPDYGSWAFKDDAPVDAATVVPDVFLNFSTLTYQGGWRYEPSTNTYLRLEAGKPFMMQDGSTIHADNVAMLVTDIHEIPGDDDGRLAITTVGGGDALILQDGKQIVGTWKKPSVDERTRFYDADGNEVQWNAGKTWIEVVPTKDTVALDDGSSLF